jgi:hypothetical protein
LSEALKHLAKADKKLGAFIKKHGVIKLTKPEFTEPYEALISAVAHQQLHGKAAITILNRLRALDSGNIPAPASLLALSDEAIRACGFSGAKMRALRDIAARAADGRSRCCLFSRSAAPIFSRSMISVSGKVSACCMGCRRSQSQSRLRRWGKSTRHTAPSPPCISGAPRMPPN